MERDQLRTELIENETFIELAILCDEVLIEENGTVSIIRVINRMRPPYPDDLVVSKQIHLALMLVEGWDDPQVNTIQLDLVAPDGTKEEGTENEFVFPEDRRNMVQTFQIQFTGDQTGVYWFELNINGRLRKRLPLQVWIPALVGDLVESEGSPSEYGVESDYSLGESVE